MTELFEEDYLEIFLWHMLRSKNFLRHPRAVEMGLHRPVRTSTYETLIV